MPILYRTTGPWGAGTGVNLDADEIDGNIWELVQRLVLLETNPPEPNQIASITQTGNAITIYMEDGASYGPFTLPRPVQRPTETLDVADATLTPTLAQTMFYFRCSHALGCAVTIPANSAQAFLIDTELHFRQSGAGALSLAGAPGVTLNVPGGYQAATDTVGAVVTAKKVATDTWDLFGLLAAETTA